MFEISYRSLVFRYPQMIYTVITTIQKPTASVLGLVDKLNEVGGKLIVAGDKKGPADFHPPGGG